MRVVYVSSSDGGGTVTHLQTLAPSVAATGVDVHVVCADEGLAETYRRAGVTASVLQLRHKFDFARALRLRSVLRGAEVVHTHDRRAGLLTRPLARALGARVIDTYHGVPDEIAPEVRSLASVPNDGPPHGTAAAHRYLRLEAALARLGLVVVPSRALARFLREQGFPDDRLRVIPYGIDLRRSEPAPPHDPFVIATSAFLIPRKGLDTLVAACAEVERPLVLEIFGEGPTRAALERQARELGVEARFHGYVSDVRERLLEVDLFALPTRGDNLPVAILEAMAAALPVVATRVGGVPELVAHRETGLLVDVDDVRGFAAGIDELAADPEQRAAYALAGARRAAELFEAGVVATRMVELYEELCA